MNSIGIMQGRLSDKYDNELQSFPIQDWKVEFERASEIGFNSIEWLLDGINDDDNPILSIHGRREMSQVARDSNISIKTLCAHAFINGDLVSSGVKKKAAVHKLHSLIECCHCAGIDYIVIPLMEQFSLRERYLRDDFIESMTRIMMPNNMKLLFESDLDGVGLQDLMSELNSSYFGINYDIGNAAALGFDIPRDIRMLKKWIYGIHLKDRKKNFGSSKRFGEGDTPFAKVISTLFLEKWNGNFIIEAPIFSDWRAEATHNLRYSQTMIAKIRAGI
jgi:hexulose-6-phosphate isomerase